MPDAVDDSRYPNLMSIPSKTFRLNLKGYSVKEVDAFLAALAIEAASLRSALEEVRQENTSLRAQLSS
jgi:DivIVA domain-containing protein